MLMGGSQVWFLVMDEHTSDNIHASIRQIEWWQVRSREEPRPGNVLTTIEAPGPWAWLLCL